MYIRTQAVSILHQLIIYLFFSSRRSILKTTTYYLRECCTLFLYLWNELVMFLHMTQYRQICSCLNQSVCVIYSCVCVHFNLFTLNKGMSTISREKCNNINWGSQFKIIPHDNLNKKKIVIPLWKVDLHNND